MNDKKLKKNPFDHLDDWLSNKKNISRVSTIFNLSGAERRVFEAVLNYYFNDPLRYRVTTSEILKGTSSEDKRAIYRPIKRLNKKGLMETLGRNSFCIPWKTLESKLHEKNKFHGDQISLINEVLLLIEYISPEVRTIFERYEGDDAFFERISELFTYCKERARISGEVWLNIITREFSSLDEFADFRNLISDTVKTGVKMRVVLHKDQIHRSEVIDRLKFLSTQNNCQVKLCDDITFPKVGWSRFLIISPIEDMLDENLKFDGITVDSKIALLTPRAGWYFRRRKGVIISVVFTEAWEEGTSYSNGNIN